MLTRLEIYGVVGLIVLLMVGGTYWYVKHLQAKVAGLEQKVAGLELQADIIKKAQEATDKTLKAMAARRKVNVQDNTKIDTVVESGDSSAVDKLLIERGLLAPKAGTSKSGSTGSTRNLSP